MSDGKVIPMKKLAGSAFAESLPDGCPPANAVRPVKQVLLRLVKANPPNPDDFISRSAENAPRPVGCDECTHKAVSYWIAAAPRENITDILKFPRFKADMKYLAKVRIDEHSGMTMPDDPNAKGHIRIWHFASFSPEKCCEVEGL